MHGTALIIHQACSIFFTEIKNRLVDPCTGGEHAQVNLFVPLSRAKGIQTGLSSQDIGWITK